MKGYNFTERVRRVLARAREEANALHHEYVGTEHMLLALDDGVAVTVLMNLNADPWSLRERIRETVRPGLATTPPRSDLPYTSRAKKVLELAMDQAEKLQHQYVGTEHLLLGLIVEGKGIAAQVLAEAGITLDAARGEVLRILGSELPETIRSGSVTAAAEGDTPVSVDLRMRYSNGSTVVKHFTSLAEAASFLQSQ